MSTLSLEQIWQVLGTVSDPEIPPVSIVEMGLVRAVYVDGASAHIILTPTFSGCPALYTIRQQVEDSLRAAGVEQVKVEWQLAPPWNSDWITPEARQKLRQFGLAPPPMQNDTPGLLTLDVVACPYCDSSDTEMKNPFGPTLCRAIYYCHACQQPFEQFKPI